MAGIAAGRLRERVAIEKEGQRIPDGQGGWTAPWISHSASVPAEVRPTGGREILRNGQLGEVQSYRVTLRYRHDVTAAMRLVWRGRVLSILNVIDDPARIRTELLCEEGRTP